MPPSNLRHELATAAFAHACAVLGTTDDAVDAAVIAVRRGGRTLASVLGEAREASMARADAAPAPAVDTPAPADLDELARALAFTRPPLERAVVDLDARHGLDQASLGQALDCTPAAAAFLAADIAAQWQRDLDPVLLAHLGPGSCADLEAVLGPAPDVAGGDEGPEADAATLESLLRAGAAAGAHAAECDACRDRMRAMVSVRTLLGRAPLGEPPSVVLAAANTARLGDVEPRRTSAASDDGRRGRRRSAVAAAAAAALAIAVAGGVMVARADDGDVDRVEALTKLPAAANALAVSPAVVDPATSRTVRLRNLAGSSVRWTATTDRPWLAVSPTGGVLDGDGTKRIAISIRDDAPEGDVDASISFAGDDGSAAVVRVRSAVAHAPDIAVRRTGCDVTATVEDESELSSVTLHERRPGGEHTSPMTSGAVEGEWSAILRPKADAGTWWVTADDALGNEGRTPEQRVPAGDC